MQKIFYLLLLLISNNIELYCQNKDNLVINLYPNLGSLLNKQTKIQLEDFILKDIKTNDTIFMWGPLLGETIIKKVNDSLYHLSGQTVIYEKKREKLCIIFKIQISISSKKYYHIKKIKDNSFPKIVSNNLKYQYNKLKSKYNYMNVSDNNYIYIEEKDRNCIDEVNYMSSTLMVAILNGQMQYLELFNKIPKDFPHCYGVGHLINLSILQYIMQY